MALFGVLEPADHLNCFLPTTHNFFTGNLWLKEAPPTHSEEEGNLHSSMGLPSLSPMSSNASRMAGYVAFTAQTDSILQDQRCVNESF